MSRRVVGARAAPRLRWRSASSSITRRRGAAGSPAPTSANRLACRRGSASRSRSPAVFGPLSSASAGHGYTRPGLGPATAKHPQPDCVPAWSVGWSHEPKGTAGREAVEVAVGVQQGDVLANADRRDEAIERSPNRDALATRTSIQRSQPDESHRDPRGAAPRTAPTDAPRGGHRLRNAILGESRSGSHR